MRKTIAAQKVLPVRNHTAAARSMAGRKMMNKRIRTIMIMPMMISAIATARSMDRLHRTDWRKVATTKNASCSSGVGE
jgi:hypothetical protein